MSSRNRICSSNCGRDYQKSDRDQHTYNNCKQRPFHLFQLGSIELQ
ncbi:conserved protein of unknown function [Limnospira indica PCC 8005]|uniref:Uncharacterized protein n=1 Tax=Limnospira indica PCC 8005 TaxID=376219 RepID=A0A9P1NZY8_9CYAN|nr:conserved protein of unknown function [Limnospira indica PCC 8005]